MNQSCSRAAAAAIGVSTKYLYKLPVYERKESVGGCANLLGWRLTRSGRLPLRISGRFCDAIGLRRGSHRRPSLRALR